MANMRGDDCIQILEATWKTLRSIPAFRLRTTHKGKQVAPESPLQKCVSPFHGNIIWAPKERVKITIAKEIRIFTESFCSLEGPGKEKKINDSILLPGVLSDQMDVHLSKLKI